MVKRNTPGESALGTIYVVPDCDFAGSILYMQISAVREARGRHSDNSISRRRGQRGASSSQMRNTVFAPAAQASSSL